MNFLFSCFQNLKSGCRLPLMNFQWCLQLSLTDNGCHILSNNIYSGRKELVLDIWIFNNKIDIDVNIKILIHSTLSSSLREYLLITEGLLGTVKTCSLKVLSRSLNHTVKFLCRYSSRTKELSLTHRTNETRNQCLICWTLNSYGINPLSDV